MVTEIYIFEHLQGKGDYDLSLLYCVFYYYFVSNVLSFDELQNRVNLALLINIQLISTSEIIKIN